MSIKCVKSVISVESTHGGQGVKLLNIELACWVLSGICQMLDLKLLNILIVLNV